MRAVAIRPWLRDLATVTDCSIRITLTRRPDPDRYAAAVLGCQTVLAMVGLDDIATVHPDPGIVSDEELGELADRWANSNPWL